MKWSELLKILWGHVIQHDKEELSALLIDLRDKVGDEFVNALIELELLAGKFLEYEFEDGEPLLPLAEEKRLKLEASLTPLSKLLRVNILLGDINNNRRRIQEIFQRIDDADDNGKIYGKYWFGKDLYLMNSLRNSVSWKTRS